MRSDSADLEISSSRSPMGVLRLGLLSFMTGFSGAMMPGSLLVLVIQQTVVQKTLWPAFWLITGHALLELVLLILLVLGLRRIIARPRVRGAIGIVGGLALLYMGADMARVSFSMSLQLDGGGDAAFGWWKLMIAGIAVCLANPYFTGWWSTIGLGQLAHMAPRRFSEYLSFYIGHEGADYTWYFVVALIIITGSRWLTDRIYQSLILFCAIVLILLSLWFLVTGTRLIINHHRDKKAQRLQNSPEIS
ncbi:MAG: LysE family transporter [Candidatus Sumerlaeota bacterium]